MSLGPLPYFPSSFSRGSPAANWFWAALYYPPYKAEARLPINRPFVSNSTTSSSIPLSTGLEKTHCKLATFLWGQKPMLPSRRYRSMSPAGRQKVSILQWIYQVVILSQYFPMLPSGLRPRATLENIGFGSPLDNASLYPSKPPLGKATLAFAIERKLLVC